MLLEPGQVYAERFAIEQVLGTGSFSHVYRVRAQGFSDPLALKVSKEPIVSEDVAQRAVREVTVQKSIDSPHVPRIHDYGLRTDGHFYVLMDLLPGRALDEAHDFDAQMEVAELLEIMDQVARALEPLHRDGIVHRDVKPENIFWDRPGRTAYLIDFGLARSWDDQELHGMAATAGHKLVGTPHYAQPEQLLGSVLSPAADVYSLGMIAYELLSGRTPFVERMSVSEIRIAWLRTPMEWVDAHSKAKVVKLSRHRDDVPGHLARAIYRALAKRPDDRFANATAFAAALRPPQG